MQPLPPRWLDKLAHRICAPHLREELLGDLYERYALRHRRNGAATANRLFLREVFSLLRPSIMRRKPSPYRAPSAFSRDMLRNYFKIGSRVLVKNGSYSLIHLTGLSIGLWACMMVATVVIDSLSYDRQWSRKNDIYRVLSLNKMGAGLFNKHEGSPSSLPAELEKRFPEVESWCSFSHKELQFKIRPEDSQGIQTDMLTTDSTVNKLLDIKLVAGSLERSTHDKWTLLVTRSFAAKMFPGQDPLGKIILEVPRYSWDSIPYQITGLIEDLPYNTHFRTDVIRLKPTRLDPLTKDGFISFGTNYMLLKPGTDPAAFTRKVNAWYAKFTTNHDHWFEFQPVRDIYLHSNFAQAQHVRADANTIYIFAGVAVLLLFIACINFVNLSTAKAFARVKEAGVRKILSGSRSQLIMQLLTETLLLFGASVGLAAMVYYFTLPSVEDFLGHELVLTFTSNALMAVGAILIFAFTALLTGLYPAWIISGFQPAHTLRGLFTASMGQNGLRKTLVVAQFSISIIVLLATIVVSQQLDLMKHKPLGYDPANLLSIGNTSWDGKGPAFKNELQSIAGVVRSSFSNWQPGDGGGDMQRQVEDPMHANRRIDIWYIAGDTDLAETMGLKLQKGRLLSPRYADARNEDSLENVNPQAASIARLHRNALITASAARILHVEKLDEHSKITESVPVGVIGDFHNESLYEKMKPTLIWASRALEYSGAMIRIQPGTEEQVTAGIERLWKKFYPGKQLRLENIQTKLHTQYEAESKMHQLFLFFSGLTMFLSALGIFGLVVQAAEQRAKEVGIRKVLGASVAGIVGLISKDFVKLVMIAIVVASPLAWLALQKWLENYPYRTAINWWVFGVTGAATLLVTIGTVSFQAIRAALADPVRSLRNE